MYADSVLLFRRHHRVPSGVWRRMVYAIGLLLTGMSLYTAPAGADEVLIETGRRIYEEGVLPDGEPLRAVRPEGFFMEGEHAACVVCHRRSGMGSVEGNADTTVLVPPVTGVVLFAPSRYATIPLDPSHHYIPNAAWERVLTRSAYDAESLERALREGLDPNERQLMPPMPRYGLDDRAMQALTAYLAQLGSESGPGVEHDALHLATVIAADADPYQAEAVTDVLQQWASYARGSGVPWRLHVWKLAGDAATWQEQLATYYGQRPVFALLSGIGRAEWAPVHRFCERQRLPCVLPSVEVLPETVHDWYSIYYSPGVDLEAEILARYLHEQVARNKIIQLYSDASGQHAAEILNASLDDSAYSFSKRRYRMTSPRAALQDITGDDALVLWLRPDQIMQLATELPVLPTTGPVFISALLAAPEELSLPEDWKRRVRFVSLFDDLGLQGEIARIRIEDWLERAGLAGSGNRRLQSDAYAASYLFNDALGKIRQQEIRRPAVPLNRKHVLETLESLINKYDDSTGLVDTDSHVAWYGRMSLGPRQRVAVRGGSILRYRSPASDRLTAASGRIVP